MDWPRQFGSSNFLDKTVHFMIRDVMMNDDDAYCRRSQAKAKNPY